MWYVRDVLYAVLYVSVSCFVVRGCGVSRRYIDVLTVVRKWPLDSTLFTWNLQTK